MSDNNQALKSFKIELCEIFPFAVAIGLIASTILLSLCQYLIIYDTFIEIQFLFNCIFVVAACLGYGLIKRIVEFALLSTAVVHLVMAGWVFFGLTNYFHETPDKMPSEYWIYVAIHVLLLALNTTCAVLLEPTSHEVTGEAKKLKKKTNVVVNTTPLVYS